MSNAPPNLGDWVCLDRNNYAVQLAIESEWPLPSRQRHLQNFSFGRVVECMKYEAEDEDEDETWCYVELADHSGFWLPASWLYAIDRQNLNEVLIEGISSLSSLLPISSRISVAGTPFDLKIFPTDPAPDR